MKKLVSLLFISTLIITSCNDELTEVSKGMNVTSNNHTIISLYAEIHDKEALVLKDNTGLKSLAIDFTSTVSPGDTIYWKVDTTSTIKSLDDIIIISKSFEGDPFVGNIVFNDDNTQCYGIISAYTSGTIKYDIKYTCNDGTIVVVDPYIDVIQIDD